MKNINPTQTKAWKALEAHFAANKDRQIKDLFAADPARFDNFSTTFGGKILLTTPRTSSATRPSSCW